MLKRSRMAAIVILLCVISHLFAVSTRAANGPYETEQRLAVVVHGGGTVVAEALAGAPAPVPKKLTLADGESGFLRFSYREPGIWRYRIYQSGTLKSDETADSAIYMLTVQVQATDQKLLTVYTIQTEKGKTEKIEFTNKQKTRVQPHNRKPDISIGTSGLPSVQTGDLMTGAELLIPAAAGVICLILFLIRKKGEKS